jgi:phosphoglycerol transferase
MTAPASAARPSAVQLALLAALVAMFAYLLHRNLGLNPAIMADEWYYSKMSRLMPLSEAVLPSYLYLWIYGASNACGDGFLDCVRVGNALFFVGAAPLLYGIARQVLPPVLALAAALASLLLPLNLYTALFMPESMYYFGFCLLSWVALTRTGWGWLPYALALGAVLGLASLVKVHALFLLPALCVFVLAVRRGARPDGPWLRQALLSAAAVVLATFALKFGLGYAFAGPGGLSLFGTLYGGMAQGSSHQLAPLVTPALVNGAGHAMALAVLFALPLALAIHQLASRAARVQAGREGAMLALYALLMLLAAVGMTVAFTASLGAVAADEMLRLHLRYYSFVFPLLCIVALAAIGRAGERRALAARLAIAAPLAALLLAAPLALPRYGLAMHDGPDISMFGVNGTGVGAAVAIELLAVLLWAGGSRWAAALFAGAALPLLAAMGLAANTAYLKQLMPSGGPPDRAGRFAHRYVAPAERKLIAVVGTGPQETMRAQFYIDDTGVALVDLPKDAPIEPFHVPPLAKWMLVVGHHRLPDGLRPVVATAEYSLVRLVPSGPVLARASLSAPFGHGSLLAGAEGLAVAERFGRWSDGARVVLHLDRPLPRHAVVVLAAHAFGPNVGLPFTMRAGGQEAHFTLASATREVGLRFETAGDVRTLEIEVPRPTAPAELGLGTDRRKLGIGLAGIAIAAAAEPVLTAN